MAGLDTGVVTGLVVEEPVGAIGAAVAVEAVDADRARAVDLAAALDVEVTDGVDADRAGVPTGASEGAAGVGARVVVPSGVLSVGAVVGRTSR